MPNAEDTGQGDSSGQESVSEGSSGRREDQPRGTGASEGQVDDPEYVWPAFDDVEGILYELAAGLFGSPEEAFPSFQIENQGLLESALGLPHQPYYESFADKLAALVRSIACNHALVDGNKRLAVTVLHSTLVLNGRVWLWSDEDAANAMVRAASGDDDFRWLAAFIRRYTLEILSPEIVTLSLDERLRAVMGAIQVAWDVALPQQIEATIQPDLLRLITPAQLVANIKAAIAATARGTEEAAPLAVRTWLRGFGKDRDQE